MNTNEIKVGDGATELHWTDSDPFTVVKIIHSKKIVVQSDNYTRVKGSEQDGSAEYTYTPNPEGHTAMIRLAKNGLWYTRGGMKGGRRFRVGSRRRYYDPSF